MAGNRKPETPLGPLASPLARSLGCLAMLHLCVGAAPPATPWPVTLREKMVRLNAVGFRLGTTAAKLCPRTAAGTGLTLDYIEAYDAGDRPAIRELLKMSNRPQIAAVAPGSPADQAGVVPGDEIAAIDGVSVEQIRSRSRDASLFADELEDLLAAKPADAPIALALDRGGERRIARLQPVAICSARFVIKTGRGFDGFTDGTNAALSDTLIGFARNDDELALVAAHELGHIVNRDAQARSIAQRRAMEDRADLMGVRLSYCAGYDPVNAQAFWLRRDAQDWLRFLRDPTHRSRKARVALMREEARHLECPPQTLAAQGLPDHTTETQTK